MTEKKNVCRKEIKRSFRALLRDVGGKDGEGGRGEDVPSENAFFFCEMKLKIRVKTIGKF